MNARLNVIKTSPEFQRVAKTGSRWHCSSFILQILKTDPGAPFRIGFTASRKVGNAVVRNRAKRRLREMARTFHLPFPPGVDMVLIAKTAAASADFTQMGRDLERGLRAAGLLP